MNGKWLLYVIKKYGERLVASDGTVYYRIPHWFTIEEDTPVLHTETPKELTEAIVGRGLGRKPFVAKDE